MIKKIFTIFILFLITACLSGFVKPDVYRIDAKKNAVGHNNLGLIAVSDGNYNEAIQEFSLAILLNPATQATAVYYNNLGETYIKLGYFKKAQDCFEKSIKQYNLNFLYYQNLIKTFKAQNIVDVKIKYYQNRDGEDQMDTLIIGLLYIANGNVERGVIKLDEFCMAEPNLLITSAVRGYLKEIVPQ